MHIEHVAIWTRNIETVKAFYETWFGARAGTGYVNPGKRFESCFLTFPGGARLELMQSPLVYHAAPGNDSVLAGYAHIAFAVGSEARVDSLTADLAQDGHPVIDGPRRTGDGYYESVVLDPGGNRIEITV